MSYWWALGISTAIFAVTLSLHLSWHRGVHPRPWIAVARYLHVHVFIAIACGVLAGVLAGALGYKGYQILYGPNGPLQPPQPAQKPHGAPSRGRHGLGFLPQRKHKGRPRTFSAAPAPAAVDLSQYAPPVGNQAAINSCAAWAVGYGLRSWYANRDGHPLPRGGAPMYLYSQAAGGSNQGTSFPAVFQIVVQQGIDSRGDYYQGDYNYYNPPTAVERRNAAQWRSVGFQTLFAGQGQGIYAEQAIKQALAGGDPVTIGIPIYDNIYAAGSGSYYITGVVGNYYGGHALSVYKYDDNGVWVENSWSTAWGLNGWAEISWGFINHYALEADEMLMPHPAPPAPTARPAPPVRPHLFLLLHDQHLRPLPAYWPTARAILKKGIILKGADQQKGVWIKLFVPRGQSWFLKSNLRKVQ